MAQNTPRKLSFSGVVPPPGAGSSPRKLSISEAGPGPIPGSSSPRLRLLQRQESIEDLIRDPPLVPRAKVATPRRYSDAAPQEVKKDETPENPNDQGPEKQSPKN
jgi:hypothetical protein